jgi:hypothetical protein
MLLAHSNCQLKFAEMLLRRALDIGQFAGGGDCVHVKKEACLDMSPCI